MTDGSRLRAVFDTNVVIAALMSPNPNSPTAELLSRWRAREFTLIYSPALRAEYVDTLTKREIDLQRAKAFLSQLEEHGEMVEVSRVEPIVEADPDDDIVVA